MSEKNNPKVKQPYACMYTIDRQMAFIEGIRRTVWPSGEPHTPGGPVTEPRFGGMTLSEINNTLIEARKRLIHAAETPAPPPHQVTGLET